MINGLKMHFASSEIVEMLSERQKYHEEKADFYGAQIKALEDGGVGRSPNMSRDPLTSLESSRKTHREKSALFRLFASHVIPNETYELTENDLTRLELLARWLR